MGVCGTEMGSTDKKYIWNGKLDTGLSGYSQFVNDVHRERNYFGENVEIIVKVIKDRLVSEKIHAEHQKNRG